MSIMKCDDCKGEFDSDIIDFVKVSDKNICEYCIEKPEYIENQHDYDEHMRQQTEDERDDYTLNKEE